MRQRLTALALVSALLSAGGLSLAPAATAAPAKPTLATVPTGRTNPVLSWTAPSGGVRFDVQVASQSDFASGTVRYSVSTANTYATPPDDLPVGTYSWRVRAADAAGAWGPYAQGTFVKSLSATDVPTLRLPANGMQLSYPTDTLVLAWDSWPGAKSYEVQLDDDPQFVQAPNPTTTTNTSFTPQNPSFSTPVYWRVRAKSSTGVTTDWSSVWSYSMVWLKTERPQLLSPIASASVEEVVLDWAPLRGASSYELQLSPDANFNNPIGGTKTVNSTTFSPSPTIPAGAYYWRVRGLSSVRSTAQTPEPSAWSETGTFTRAWPAPGTLPRGTDPALAGTSSNVMKENGLKQVTLVSPADGSYSEIEPRFVWTPQREASQYEIWVGSDLNFSPNTYTRCVTNRTSVTPYIKVSGSGTDCPMTSGVPISNGEVRYWKVRGIDSPAGSPVVYGEWSETRSMLYDIGTPTQWVDTTGTVPVLNWTAVKNTGRYKVTVSPGPGNTNTKCGTITAVTYNTAFVPSALSAECSGTMAWTVQAQEDDNSTGKQPIGAWPTFQLNALVMQPSMGTVALTPSDGLRPPTMLWNAIAAADKYVVWFSPKGANSYRQAYTQKLALPGFAYVGRDTQGWPAVLTPGDYDFFVQAVDKNGVGIATTITQSFTIGSTWPLATLNGPCGGTAQCTLGDTPELDWEPMTNVGLYHVYVATDPQFTNILWDWKTPYSNLTPSFSLPDSQAGQAYYWYVRPCATESSCGPFGASVYGYAGSFRKLSKAVEALSPKAGDASVKDEVTFTWKDYLATNRAVAGSTTTQEAASYEVQVSTTAEFTNIIDTSPRVDQTTYTAQDKTYPDGPLYWRVRAYDATGNPLTYSCAAVATTDQPACTAFSFIKSSAAPTQIDPGAGASVTRAPVLSWNAMPYAHSFDVEVYKGSSADPANRVVLLNTRSTSAIPNSPLAKGAYVWRVRRVDVRGLAGSWSALRSFLVAGNPVTLSLPGNGSNVTPNRVLLQWRPASGATRYRVEISNDSAFGTVLETRVTDLNSWAPSFLSPSWPSGTYWWRVSSLDANDAVLATSPVWSLTRTLAAPPPPAPAWSVTRYAGSNRYATAVAVSKGTFPTAGVPVVYVATGSTFADALAGGPAAAKQGGPVLLVEQTAIPSVVASELSRLRPARIVILGGTGAVSSGVATRLDAFTTGPVVRIAGADRFDTAGKVALYAFGKSAKAYVANGTNYPDALAGAVSAAKNNTPLLLVTKDAVPSATGSAMRTLGVSSSVVLGGTGAVSAAVMTKVRGTARLAGANRYATAVAISKATFASASSVYLATGSNFPDALSGTPSAARRSAPLLLANGGCLTKDTVAEIKRLKATKAYILGGTGAVPDSVGALRTC